MLKSIYNFFIIDIFPEFLKYLYILTLYEKVAALSLEEEICLKTEVIDGSTKLKLKGIHWPTPTVEPQYQPCRAENRNGPYSQWAGLKAILRTLDNEPPDEPRAIATKTDR